MLLIEKLAEEKIQEAINEGQFNDLPSKGKPYRLDGYLFEDPGERIYHKILKNNGFIPLVLDYKKRIEELSQNISFLLDQFRQQYGQRFARVMDVMEIDISYPPENYWKFLKQHHYFLDHHFTIWVLAKNNSVLKLFIHQFNSFVSRNKQRTLEYLEKRNELILNYNEEVIKILMKKRDLMRIETTLALRGTDYWHRFLDYQFPSLPRI